MLPFTHSRRSSAVLSFLFVAFFVLLLWNHDTSSLPQISNISNLTPAAWSDYVSASDVAAPLNGTANATLGFGAILAVSPHATWRSEGLHAAARRTGLNITVPPQHEPDLEEVAEFLSRSLSGTLNKGSAKAWLAHLQVMNAARNYSSALILEDDSDWDVKIHDQAAIVAEAIRNLTVPATIPSEWPWGEDWDVLWLGHCGERLPYEEEEADDFVIVDEEDEGDAPKRGSDGTPPTANDAVPATKRDIEPPGEDDYITLFDPTLPPTVSSYDPRMSGDSQMTRWVQHAAGPICTFAYAVTGASVAKMLAMEHGNEQAFDLWMHTRCRNRQLRCFTVNPEMFHHHIAAGLPSSLVNEGHISESGKNYTENVMYSARCNWDKPDDALVSCRQG